jgi:hypothetical protein
MKIDNLGLGPLLVALGVALFALAIILLIAFL